MADAVAVFTPGQRLVSTSGVPYANATINFYNAGSTDPKIVYSDGTLTNSLGSTVYTDSAGYPVTAEGGSTKTQVFTTTGTYKIVISDTATGETITHDNCLGAVVSGGVPEEEDTITQEEADLRYLRNPNALSAVSDLADADLFGFWQIAGSGNRGITYADIKTKLTTDFRADGRMFPSGTRLPFQQTTPPTGWTKESGSAYNDATLRFTTGTASTGGTASFNTVFASRTFTGTVGNDTPTEAKTAAHAHSGSFFGTSIANSGAANTNPLSTPTNTGSTGGSNAHNHSLTMNAADFAVKFAEVTIGQKS